MGFCQYTILFIFESEFFRKNVKKSKHANIEYDIINLSLLKIVTGFHDSRDSISFESMHAQSAAAHYILVTCCGLDCTYDLLFATTTTTTTATTAKTAATAAATTITTTYATTTTTTATDV